MHDSHQRHPIEIPLSCAPRHTQIKVRCVQKRGRCTNTAGSLTGRRAGAVGCPLGRRCSRSLRLWSQSMCRRSGVGCVRRALAGRWAAAERTRRNKPRMATPMQTCEVDPHAQCGVKENSAQHSLRSACERFESCLQTIDEEAASTRPALPADLQRPLAPHVPSGRRQGPWPPSPSPTFEERTATKRRIPSYANRARRPLRTTG